MKRYYKLHFESEVYEADTPEEAEEQYIKDCVVNDKFPSIRQNYVCDEMGFPIK